eukprot:m.105481 g.105481  ORF g.105481 m.105481 type:complete len:299 (-) comp27651_c0_seq1:853-1749(-)
MEESPPAREVIDRSLSGLHEMWKPPAPRYPDAIKRQPIPPGIRCDIETVSWFHTDITRLDAEGCLLALERQNGDFLLRDKMSNPGELTVSIRISPTKVDHVSLNFNPVDKSFQFGNQIFTTFFLLEFYLLGHPSLASATGEVFLQEPVDAQDKDDVEEVRPYFSELKVAATPQVHLDVSTNPTPDHGAVTGYLLKMGHVRKNWKMRWFELKNTSIYYRKKDRDAKIIGEIDLTEASSLSRGDNLEGFGKRNSLKLVLGSADNIKLWHLCAVSEGEIELWIQGIRNVMDRVRQQKLATS